MSAIQRDIELQKQKKVEKDKSKFGLQTWNAKRPLR